MSDDKIDRYLFDPQAPPAPEVERLEQILKPLRYDADAHPLRSVAQALLPVPAQTRVSVPHRRFLAFLAAAAMLACVVIGGSAWLWSWPAGEGWKVVGGPIKSLPVGRTVLVKDKESLLVKVARIGWMRIGGKSALTLLSTHSNRHRLRMTEGTIRVSVWAPPGSVAIATPAGDVIDLGCEFILRVNRETSQVDVLSGWVQLNNPMGESLVPAGASSEMNAYARPGVPLYRDASPEFRAAVRALETGRSPASIDTVVRTARYHDVLTLLILAARDVERERVLDRAAELAPARSAETMRQARDGDTDAIWKWMGELPLPPAKSWRRNWQDLFFFG